MTSSTKSYLRLALEEPYRLFFPLATLSGIMAVSLWPLFHSDALSFYPNTVHIRMMITGFMGGFIFGFLSTALPRMSETARIKDGHVAFLALLWFCSQVAYFFAYLRSGDILLLLFLTAFVYEIVPRILKRKDDPPCTFILIAFGMLSGIAGSIILTLFDFAVIIPSELYQLGMRLLTHGFVLFMILGAAPFIFRKVMREASPLFCKISGKGMPSSGFRQIRALICGILLLSSYTLEAFEYISAGRLIMLITLLFYTFVEIPLCIPKGKAKTLAHALQLGTAAILVSSVGVLFDPLHALAWKHLMIIGGFNYITIVIAIHVINAHSGRLEFSAGKIVFFRWASAFIWAAIVSRIVGEYMSNIYASHMIYASYSWCIGMLIWVWYVIPRVFIEDTE